MRKNLTLNTKIDVLFYYDGEAGYARPVEVNANGRAYRLGIVSSWYVTGSSSLTHHYVVDSADGEIGFKLALETSNLTWELEDIKDLTQDSATHYVGLVGVAV